MVPSSSWRLWVQSYKQRLYHLRFIFLLLLVLQLSPAAYYYTVCGRLPYPGELVYQSISLLMCSAIPILFLALFSHQRLRRVFMSIVLVLYGLIFLFEFFLVSSYSSLYTDSIALNILATNPDEASGFLQGVNYKAFYLPIFILVVLSLVFLWIHRRRAKIGGSKLLHIAFLIVLILPTLVSLFWVIPLLEKRETYLYMAPVERMYKGTITCVRDAETQAEYIARMKHIDLGELRVNSDLQGATVVLVLGESLRRDYMHSYGYPVENTPKQDSLIGTGDLILFRDVVSPAPSTEGSLLQAMTTYTREDGKRERFGFPTLSLILSKAGYYTYWVSNQEKQGSLTQPVSALAFVTDSAFFIKERGYGGWNVPMDLDLIPHLRKKSMIPEKDGRTALFEVVHLMGSHTIYADRFPKEMARFGTKDLPKKLPNGMAMPEDTRKQEILRDYVSSVYYNDLVLSEIIRQYSSEPAIVIYLSDHGQTLYDNPRHLDYHGHEVSPGGVSVPFMVYFSPEMRRLHPDLYQKVYAAKDRRIMTDLLTNSISGLLGVETKYYKPKLDFFSPSYDNSRRRLVEGYDGGYVEF